jgi:hypothetical protein
MAKKTIELDSFSIIELMCQSFYYKISSDLPENTLV